MFRGEICENKMNRDSLTSLQEFKWHKEEGEEESFDFRYCVLNLIFFFVIVLRTKTEVWKVKYEKIGVTKRFPKRGTVANHNLRNSDLQNVTWTM